MVYACDDWRARRHHKLQFSRIIDFRNCPSHNQDGPVLQRRGGVLGVWSMHRSGFSKQPRVRVIDFRRCYRRTLLVAAGDQDRAIH